jgi:hypothetical protein
MRIFAIAAFAVIAAVAPASADVHVNGAAKISIDVPHDWKLAGGGNQMVAADPKEEAAVSLVVTDTDDPKKAADLMDQLLSQTGKDIKLDPAKKIDLNGLKALQMMGSATVSGKKAGIMAMIVMTPIGKLMNVVAIVEESKFATHQKALTGILMSIKPAK